jgi:hypothetical protein
MFQNEEFSQALSARIENKYKASWVSQYFQYKTRIIDNTVVFWDFNKTVMTRDERFATKIKIPNKTKPFFLPMSEWKPMMNDSDEDIFYPIEFLSNTKHGCLTNGFPYSRSPYYKAPYVLVFKTNLQLPDNYLIFNNFLKSNSYGCILALLTYDDDRDKFIPVYTSDVVLHHQPQSVMLNNVLEFYLYDSQQRLVEIQNASQLFVSITIV